MAELTTIARPYAKAAFLFANESNTLDAWESSLALLAALVSEAQLSEVLSNPALSSADKVALLVELGGGQLAEQVTNLLEQLAQNKRLSLLPAIHELYHQLMAEQQQFADVEVLSAFELSDDQEQALVASLKKRLGVDVRVNTQVDEALIGGVLIRAGDTVIDNSVRGRLRKLAEQLNSRV